MAAGDTLRRITPNDQLIVDINGNVVGVKSPNANGSDLRFDPSSVAITGGSSYGVSSATVTANSQSAATANTTAIRAALSAGRPVLIDAAGGTVYINGTIAVPEGLSFKTAPGTTIAQADNTGLPMLVNAAYQATPATVTVTWSAGPLVSIAWANHGCVENDAFVLQGGTPAGIWDDVYRVASVVDANTITARLPFVPSAGPGGTVTAVRCTRNIDVDVTLDYRVSTNGGASGQNQMVSIFAFVADSKVRVIGKNTSKYVILLAGAINIDADARGYPNSNSDTLKIYGPANNVTAKVQGQAAEDCVSVQCLEPAAYIAYMPCKGNIRGVKIKDPAAYATTLGSGCFAIYTDATYTISGIEVEGGELLQVTSTGVAPAIGITTGSGFTSTTANLQDLTVKGSRLATVATNVISVGAPMRKLHVKQARFDVQGNNNARLVYNTAQLDDLVFEDCEFEFSNWSAATGQYVLNIVGAVKNIVFKKCQIKGISTMRFLLVSAGIQTVVFDDCEASTMDVLCRLETTATGSPTPEVIFRGGNYASCTSLVQFAVSGKLRLEGPNVAGSGNGVCRADGASVVVDVIGDAVLATPSQLMVSVNSGQANLKTPQMAYDIGGTGVKKSAGNECIHTGSTRGTITTGLPVICDGTNWASKTNLSLTF